MPVTSEVIDEYSARRNLSSSRYGQIDAHLKAFLPEALRELSVYPEESLSELSVRVRTRVKHPDRVLEKVDRAGRRWKNPQLKKVGITSLNELESEIRDLVGGRVVLNYLDEARKLARYVQETAKGKQWGVSDVGDWLVISQPNGYRAYHMTIRVQTPDGPAYGEIQFRSMLQDAWQIITHNLTYKPRVQINQEVASMVRALSDGLYVQDRAFIDLRDSLNRELEKRQQEEASRG